MCTFGLMLESTLNGQDSNGMPQHLCYDPGSKTKDRKKPGYYNHHSDHAIDNGRTIYYTYLLKVPLTMLQSSSVMALKIQITRGKRGCESD